MPQAQVACLRGASVLSTYLGHPERPLMMKGAGGEVSPRFAISPLWSSVAVTLQVAVTPGQAHTCGAPSASPWRCLFLSVQPALCAWC